MHVQFTDGARSKIREYLEAAPNQPQGLRLVAMRQGRRNFRYDFTLVLEGETYVDDIVEDGGDFRLFLDPQSAEWLDGTTVDFVSDLSGSGFKIDNPNSTAAWDDPIAEHVQRVLDERITPTVASHGGWVDLVAVKDGTAYIEMGGGCQGCGMSHVTLSQGIEAAILDGVPEITKVVDATDHAGGSNPYYSR
jgi:Fe/S biogenesis protein NfuA